MNWDEYEKAIEEDRLFEHIDAEYDWGIKKNFDNDYHKFLPSNFCVAPFTNMEITAEGTSRPCCKYDAFKLDDSKVTLHNSTVVQLFNSEEMNKLRDDFMRNEKPEKCKVCWNEEKSNIISLRQIYNKNWLQNPDSRYDIKRHFKRAFSGQPTNLDLKLSNLCNLRCRICGPWSSTQWIKDYKDLGWADKRAMVVWAENAKEKLLTNEENVKILTSWADGILRIEFYGGEPLMQQEHDQILDIMINSGSSKDQNLCYNTNGTHFSDDLVIKWKQFDFVVVNFSIDDIGKRFEYQRKNAIYDEVISNLENFKLLSELYNVDGRFYLYLTISMYNIYYLDEIIEQLSYLNFEFVLNLLHHPLHSNITNLPDSIKKIITNKLLNFNNSNVKYHKQSASIKNIIDFMNSTSYDHEQWIKFLEYNRIIDENRNEIFKEIFPEFYKIALKAIPKML